MLTPFRPAVFACPMRQRHGEKPKRAWPPPYPAWPELADPSTFYTLPTLCSHPDISMALCWPKESYWDSDEKLSLSEHLHLLIPDLAEEIIQGITEKNIQSLEEMDTIDVFKLFQSFSRGIAETMGMEGSLDPEWDAFAYLHEFGHYESFIIGRATTEKVSSLASAILDLLRPANVAQCGNFWTEFRTRNRALVDFLEKGLVFEEIRASLHALTFLDPDITASIKTDLRELMAEDGILGFFDKLTDATNEDWHAAMWLSLVAENTPADPIESLYFLCSGGADVSSETQLSAIQLQKTFNRVRKDKAGWDVTFADPKDSTLAIEYTPPNKDEVGTTDHRSLADVKELVFLESLRQQLANPFGLGLVCPFQQRRRTCCGFGHYLRAIWEQVPPHYRYPKSVPDPETGKKLFFRKPPKACLNYGLG
jgi:hypothetical protein